MFEILAICCFREVTPYIGEVRMGGAGDHVMCTFYNNADSEAKFGAVVL